MITLKQSQNEIDKKLTSSAKYYFSGEGSFKDSQFSVFTKRFEKDFSRPPAGKIYFG
ncbi:hypothetical protein [Methanosarcina sp. UBA289]|uniref:hypothetical protein n=1 Tax=Methanosarcina sp. UBA289 TaxID=1915574 RepID=UPI0025D738DE|nr:hypothetical protein [Methanosarcina sp. UBA289]